MRGPDTNPRLTHQQIQRQRVALGMTQQQLAHSVNVSQTLISQIERGQIKLSDRRPLLRRLRQVLRSPTPPPAEPTPPPAEAAAKAQRLRRLARVLTPAELGAVTALHLRDLSPRDLGLLLQVLIRGR